MWCLALYSRRVSDMRGENEDTGDGEPDGMSMLFFVPRRADDSGTVADEGDGKRRHLTSMRDLCFETDLGMSTATPASLTLHHVLALVLVSLFYTRFDNPSLRWYSHSGVSL
jgi:hypothetical protein